MEFKATGLPYDPTVYAAFLILTKLQPLSAEGMLERSLATALLLKDYTNDPDLLAAVLTQNIGKDRLSLLEQRLGEKCTAPIKELHALQQTNFAQITKASDKAKLLILANYATALHQMNEALKDTLEQTGTAPQLQVSGFDDILKCIKAMQGTTSCPALEEKADKLSRKMAQFISDGVVPEPAEVSRYPSFEETQLLDDPSVRNVYRFITNLADAVPEEVALAIRIGQLLSDIPAQPNPAEVAAGLIKYAYHNYTPEHIRLVVSLVDDDTRHILSQASSVTNTAALSKTSPEIKRIVIAAGIAQIEGVEVIIPVIEQRNASSPEFRPTVEQALNYLKEQITQVHGMTSPALNQSGSPRLEEVYADIYRDTMTRIQNNLRNPLPKKRPSAGPQL